MAELFSSQNRSGVLQGNLSLFLCHAAPLVTFRGLRHPFRKFVSWYNPLRSGQAETRGDFQPLQHHIQVQKNQPKSKIEPIFRYSDPTLCEAGLNAAQNKIFEFIFQFSIDLCTQILITLPQEGVILDYLDSRYVRDFFKILKKSSDNLDLSR